ncbi:MAG TPA: tail fiber domain-containing protein, partial [Bacteroidales bacterium]|nr:tail fiber domain-containing protein [Bacteroidales bacterium]
LRPVQFQYKKDIDNDNCINYGLIAQEVKFVMPHLVKGGNLDSAQQDVEDALSEEGYMVLNYINLVPVLVKAIQEQQAEIEALKAEKARYAELEAKISVLEEKLKILDNMAEK